jgi:DNA-binding response OmpR family regulator
MIVKGRPLKALIVEDEADMGQVLVEHLRRQGFTPTLVTQGTAAVRAAREIKPDVILLDLMLPDIDGFTVCETLKLDRDTNLIPIVMETARTGREHVVHGWQVGANRYLTKPFTLDELNAAIAEALLWREEMERHGSEGEIHFEFQSDVQFLEELNQLVSVLLIHTPFKTDHIQQLTAALREIGTNAIEWGHRKQLERIVTMTYRIDKEKVTMTVRDSGPGFDPKHLPHAASEADPMAHLMVREALGMREGGFGIMMARGLVDELSFNQTGNEARLVKYFQSPNPRS